MKNKSIPKMDCPEELPCIGDEKDERYDDVILIDWAAELKTTAENRGLWWYIRDWEIHELFGKRYWFNHSGYTIRKSIIKLLAE